MRTKLSPKEDTGCSLHGNARTCPNSRRLLVARVLEQGWSVMAAAEAAGVSGAHRLALAAALARGGRGGSARSLVAAARARQASFRRRRSRRSRSLRRLRMTAAQIAEVLGLALSTVSSWLQRIGLGKRSRLEPPEPPNRYERARPGELVHVDIKQLGRISKRGAGHRVLGHRKSQFRAGHRAPHDRLRIRARDGRRPQPARLRRGAADADRALRDRASCAAPSPGSPTAASASRRS